MLTIQNITKSFGDTQILDEISLSLAYGEVVALVGSNGVGKTTLLRILAGIEEVDSGSVQWNKEEIGYVPQEPENLATNGFSGFQKVEAWQIEAAADRCGLSPQDLKKRVADLSGGQRTRLAIAQVLAREPEPTTLLLDEPTNNLDKQGLAWLKEFIQEFRGAIILASHDRAFINEVATTVWELHRGKLRRYGGNYDFYISQKEAERQAAVQHYEASVEERKRLERLVAEAQARSEKGTKDKPPRDNDKYLYNAKNEEVQNVYGAKVKAWQSRLERTEIVARPEPIKRHFVHLEGEVHASKLIIRLEDITKNYEDKRVLTEINLEVRGSQRVRIVGLNGSGKSTLLSIAAGKLNPDAGIVTLGTEVKIGYFSQDVTGLDPTKSALQNIIANGEVARESAFFQARQMGLSETDLKKLPEELSRGQQAKLAFCRLLLGGYSLLILDEPTNHLDIETRECIEEGLKAYEGAILIASHDERFIGQIEVLDFPIKG